MSAETPIKRTGWLGAGIFVSRTRRRFYVMKDCVSEKFDIFPVQSRPKLFFHSTSILSIVEICMKGILKSALGESYQN